MRRYNGYVNQSPKGDIEMFEMLKVVDILDLMGLSDLTSAEVLQLMALFVVSYYAYRVFHKLKFPASRLVGPLVVVAILQASGLGVSVPDPVKVVFSVVFGIYLGLRFNKKALSRLKGSAKPALLISLLYVGITVAYGELLMYVGSMERNTAFLAVIPGGIAEAGVLAVAYGANLAQVSTFQLVRFLSIIVLVPLGIKWYITSKGMKGSTLLSEDEEPLQDASDFPSENAMDSGSNETIDKASHWRWFFIVGPLGSFVFQAIHFPAALLLGATFSVSALQILSNKHFKRPPEILYTFAQVGMGGVIGTSFTPENVQVIATLVGPMVLLTCLTLATSVILGFIFTKIFRMDALTSFMGVLPGGLSTMMILAEEFDADIVTIGSLQLVRLLTAVMVIPILYQWLL